MDISLNENDWQVVPLLPFNWAMTPVQREDWEPDTVFPPSGHWLPATVPGDVIRDALDAGLIPDPYVDMNSRACEWVSERDWVYRTRFTVDAGLGGKTFRLVFDGVDHACHVFLNGGLLGEHEGMFSGFEFEVTDRVRLGSSQANTLVVVVHHAPAVDEVMGQIGWTSRARTWKSRFAYGWDWCTRLVPVGIWKSVRLAVTEGVWIDDVWVRPAVERAGGQVEAVVRVKGKEGAAGVWEIHGRLIDPAGNLAGQAKAVVTAVAGIGSGEGRLEFEVESPRLWWPNGLGDPALYRALVEVRKAGGTVSDGRSVSCGFRTVELACNETDDSSAGALPYTLVVNGRRIFAKGWNWVPVDHMYGRVQAERYRHLLGLARHARCNLLRVWGGGLIERSEFYDLCDRLGILVWQEFPHSSSGVDNRPPDDGSYLTYIEAQARAIVPTRRNHACLALWCGGNELMERNNEPCDDSHPALARLKRVVEELDPGRAWLPTSASGPMEWPDIHQAGSGRMHDIHGPWKFSGPEEHYRLFNTIDPLAHTEFGVEGAANLSALRRYISAENRFPPDASNPVWLHHGSWWMHREMLESMFGPITDIESFIHWSQWMQAEGLRSAIESHRRRMGRCSMTLPWQFNEAYPNTACTNAVDYLGAPKPAYWWIRTAYEPLCATLKADRIGWKPGERWGAEVWVINEREPVAGLRWEASLMSLAGEIAGRWAGRVEAEGWRAARAGEIACELPHTADVFVLFLTLRDAGGGAISRRESLLSTANPLFASCLSAPSADLEVSRRGDSCRIENQAGAPALFVTIEGDKAQDGLVSDNYFCLAPGERREITGAGRETIRVTAWNSVSTILPGTAGDPAATK